jgi:hypothetical protein
MPIRRLLRLVPVVLAVTAWLAAAAPAAACSCAPTTAADYVGRPGYAIFTGTALPLQDLSVPFVVDEWFQGGAPVPGVLLTTGQERMPDGAISADTCGRTLQPGPWLVFATRLHDGRYDPGGCTVTASLDDAAGQEMLAEVRARLAGQPPPTTAPNLPSSDPPEARRSGIAAYIVAPIAIGALVFVVLVAVARRRGA